jgi:hypothetical protein
MNHEQENALVDAHWAYVESVLIVHKVPELERLIAEKAYRQGFMDGLNNYQTRKDLDITNFADFHYITAFQHGLKHGGY